MKFFLPVILFFTSLTVFSQVPDTLVKLGGRKVPVYINNIGATDVYYANIAKPKIILSISRKNLEKVIFKSGRVEKFNEVPVKIIEEGEWQAVLITKKKKDIEGLYKRREISAETLASPKARTNTIIKMQKQAANARATIILITKENNQGIPGEDPRCYMEGIAYGPEPLEEGTDVTTDSPKK